jgi:N6-adenosine-specific RNA methylase IME4
MEQIQFPNKKYQIIYADPPWSYRGKMMNSSVTDHYGVMSLKDICNLPVKDIAEKDCILFLWVTLPKLNEFMKVIKAWGFEYKTTAFVWAKKNKISDSFFMGLGRWTRANPEICVLATKGQISRKSNNIRQLQIHPIAKHSEKPAIFRQLIVDLVGDDLPRIELFAREKTEGWDVWGNEV